MQPTKVGATAASALHPLNLLKPFAQALFMGIDIGFTDRSPRESKYASCQRPRRNRLGFYQPPPGEGPDPLAEYRTSYRVVDMPRVKENEPELYQALTSELRRPPQDTWYWNRAWFGPFYDDRKVRRKLRPYMRVELGDEVLFAKMPEELAAEWRNAADESSLFSAWDHMPYEGRIEVCKDCAVRPLDDPTCYIHFSSYPAMNAFREGFMITYLYARSLPDDRVKEAVGCQDPIHLSRVKLPPARTRGASHLGPVEQLTPRHRVFSASPQPAGARTLCVDGACHGHKFGPIALFQIAKTGRPSDTARGFLEPSLRVNRFNGAKIRPGADLKQRCPSTRWQHYGSVGVARSA